MTIEGLVLGLLAAAVVPPVVTLALRRRLGPVGVALASLAATALAGLVLGLLERQPTAALAALLLAWPWQAVLSALLTPAPPRLRLALAGAGVTGMIVLFGLLGGVW